MDLEKLAELLALLAAHDVLEYSDQQVTLKMAEPSPPDLQGESFEVDYSAAHFPPPDEVN